MEFQNSKNQEPKVSLNEDPQVGIVWDKPQCVTCQHSKGRFCNLFQQDRMKVKVDIFNCPKYTKKVTDEDKAKELFGYGRE